MHDLVKLKKSTWGFASHNGLYSCQHDEQAGSLHTLKPHISTSKQGICRVSTLLLYLGVNLTYLENYR